MKIATARIAFALTALVLPATLGGCMGAAGNPNAMAYAGEPGGTIAAPPQNLGVASYDPFGPVPPFEDMKASAAIGGPAPYGAPAPMR